MNAKQLLESGMCVHCRTLHQADRLMQTLADFGCVWSNGGLPSVDSRYRTYAENTVYGIEKAGNLWVVSLASVDFIRHYMPGKRMVEYDEFVRMTTEELSVELPFGELVAEKSQDPDFPGIFLYLRRPDGTICDLMGADMDSTDKGVLRGFVWGDTGNVDYTNKFLWSANDLK